MGAEDQEKIRRDYEYKIATMQTKISSLERDLEDTREREQKASESEKRVRMLEDELEEMRRVRIVFVSIIKEFANETADSMSLS